MAASDLGTYQAPAQLLLFVLRNRSPQRLDIRVRGIYFCSGERGELGLGWLQGELAPGSVIGRAIASHPLLRAMLLAPGNFHRSKSAPTEANYLLYHVFTGSLIKGPWPTRNFSSTMSGPESLVWTGLISDLTHTTEGWLSLDDDGMPEPPPNTVLQHITISTREVNPHGHREVGALASSQSV